MGMTDGSEPQLDALRRFAHDMRNPIGALNGFVHLLKTQRDRLTPEQVESIVEGIERSGHRISDLLEDFVQGESKST